MESERRRHPRYPKGSLELKIARPGIKGILTLNPQAECLNFSRSGLQFECDRQFTVGDRLVVDLHVFDVDLNEVNAVVMSVRDRDRGQGQRCCGIRFCLEDRPMQKPNIQRTLLQIEDKLRSSFDFPRDLPPDAGLQTN